MDTCILFFKIPNEILSLLAESIAGVLKWGGSAPRGDTGRCLGTFVVVMTRVPMASSGRRNVVQTSLFPVWLSEPSPWGSPLFFYGAA